MFLSFRRENSQSSIDFCEHTSSALYESKTILRNHSSTPFDILKISEPDLRTALLPPLILNQPTPCNAATKMFNAPSLKS
ncbi:unnamed protein product [Chondrus crispus]|uniref:Uncharacterized protein n=1 Tax=Chondrus crispus TaxID=2769 RepID=R7Q4Q7_CHOCR|nr:unnamed protein product [Chondrus crispus]CDF33507.1 unnamed protein product [Chondrus crispus]|eukprot:XP_005713310.1 unnamed protein product [Chondrus crispus]